MKNTRLMLIPLLAVTVLATGCASGKFTGNAYTGAQARQAQVVKTGTVTFVKDISIQAGNSGVGGPGGALAGAVGGSNFGSGRGALIGVLGGAIIGGVIGHLADEGLNTLNGQEITLMLANGTEVAVAQEIDPKEGKFHVGDKVRMLTSPFGTSRVSR